MPPAGEELERMQLRPGRQFCGDVLGNPLWRSVIQVHKDREREGASFKNKQSKRRGLRREDWGGRDGVPRVSAASQFAFEQKSCC